MSAFTIPDHANEARSASAVLDASGYAVFSRGETGAAHVMAHRLLDDGEFELGRRRLGAWLAKRRDSGSDWAHLHFHMAIFELGIGDWNAAHGRFMKEILPTAARSDDALTDAPALLWRLAMTAPRDVELPWQAIRDRAVARLRRDDAAFVQLHHLLALAGSRDLATLDQWLDQLAPSRVTLCGRVLRGFALALRAFAAQDYRAAAAAFRSLSPQVRLLGGSRAQNELFLDLARFSAQLASTGRAAA